MTALFPTYTTIWQRAKRVLAMDTRDVLRHVVSAIASKIEEDDLRYEAQFRAAGLDEFNPLRQTFL